MSDQDEREQELTETVVASFAGTPDERLRTLMTALTRHLHAFVREVRLTEAGVGRRDRLPHRRRAHHRRQAAGVHPALRRARAVHADDHDQPRGRGDATESTVLGPFFVAGSPGDRAGRRHRRRRRRGSPAGSRERSGTSTASPSPARCMEVWEADDDGLLRRAVRRHRASPPAATSRTDEDGGFRFWALTPTPYPIPADGPVGALLAATGRSPMRAAAPALHGQRARLPHAGHAHLRGRRVARRGQRVRRPRVAGEAVRAARRGRRRTAGSSTGRWTQVRFDIVLAGGRAR